MRVIHVQLVLSLVGVAGCSSDDPQLERRGGEVPKPMMDPPKEGDGGGGGAAGAGGSGELVPFCDALAVVRAKCQRCHSNPTKLGAPVPFVTYDDFQATFFETKKWWQRAQDMVESGDMPYVALNDPPTSLMPPVQPLTADEKDTLMGWLQQGALPEGGTDCP